MTMKMKEKIDCCGSNFETNNVSFLGLLTLSVPIALFSMIVIIVLLPFSFLQSSKDIKRQTVRVLFANSSLIERQNLLQNLRCNFSVLLSKLSTSLSNKVYYYFNHMILFFIWFLLIVGVSFFV
ncbi:MAG: hypothetical protein ACJAS4_002592 [Bacteriovoracaceae bacterium]|jgi:hypothetical protein